jgi:hypothetical protein
VLSGVPLGGQGWLQVGELGLALALSACIGLGEDRRHRLMEAMTFGTVATAIPAPAS